MKPEEMFERLEPILGEKIKKLFVAWTLADRDEKQELEQLLKILYHKHLRLTPTTNSILLSPAPKGLSGGEISVGTVIYHDKKLHEFCLREPELAQHVAVFGRSGSGKTNTVRVLLKSFLKRKLPFLIFDWKKDYSQLDFEEVFTGTGITNKDVLVLPVGKRNVNCLKLNPLIPPPNVTPEIWAKQLCEVLTHAYFGGPGFESIFLKAINHCYENNGIYQGGTEYPTFADVKEYLERTKFTGREAQWMQSVMRTINSICFGGMNETVNQSVPDDVVELLQKNVILELDALGNADKTFLIETIMLWLHHHRLAKPPVKEVENIIIIEEAHHLLRQGDSGKESLIESSLREMRSLGIGIVIVDQMPSLISKVALANTYCTIALNVKTGQDVSTLAGAMLLETEQKPLLGMLPVGEAIVKLQDRYIRPFHVKIPLLSGGRRMLHYQPPSKNEEIPRIPQKTAVDTPVVAKNDGVPSQIYSKYISMENDSNEKLLLLDIANYPIDSVTARYRRLNLSARKGNQAKSKLIEDGLISPVTFTGKGAWLRLFEFNPDGVEKLKQYGQPAPSSRDGGLEHRYWQEKLAEHYSRAGYKVVKEKKINGHKADLVATKGEEHIVVEIETGKSDYIQNIRSCLAKPEFTKVIVACVSKQVLERIRGETKAIRDVRFEVEEASMLN